MPLRYVGRTPDTPSTVVPASSVYGTTQPGLFGNTLVTPSWLSAEVAALTSVNPPVTAAYVTQQAANYATQAQISTALGQYIATSQVGVPSGYAGLVSGLVPPAQLPALSTNNVAHICPMSTQLLPPTDSYTVTGTTNSFPLGVVTVANPGYPWLPIPFAYVQGGSAGSEQSRLVGSQNYALLTVSPQGQASPVYAIGYMTDDPLTNFYPVVPAAVPGINISGSPVTPQTQKPISGPMNFTLSVSGSGSTTTGYTVTGNGLVFYVLVVPAW